MIWLVPVISDNVVQLDVPVTRYCALKLISVPPVVDHVSCIELRDVAAADKFTI